jgi:hypothetical protein
MKIGIIRRFYSAGLGHERVQLPVARRAKRHHPFGAHIRQTPMQLFRLAAVFALLLTLAACTGPGITNPPPHLGDGTDML